MPPSFLWNRRAFLRHSASAATLAAARPLSAEPRETRPAAPAEPSIPHTPGIGTIPAPLAAFIPQYLESMHSPGLTLALHSAAGPATASFGLSNIDLRQPVTPAQLFEIGSISKSFCALSLLQQHDEGKLDLHRPVLDYLPWLPLDMPAGAITPHHLLTHTAGLPGNNRLFPADPATRITQTWKPGTRFWYSNLGFAILGHLAATIDRTTFAAVLQRRILDPLGMAHTLPAIWDRTNAHEAVSYWHTRDLAGTRAAPLSRAPGFTLADASGCVTSTPADMALYLAMLAARGQGPHGPLVSPASFTLFATPYIDCSDEFGPGFSYGYGIAVGTLNGHKILKHTGGMNSFASSLQVDLDSRVGAFASINAMQGFRPNPVTTFAIELLCAQSGSQADHQPVPPAPPLENPRVVANAADYTGTYTGPTGSVRILAQGTTLLAEVSGTSFPLERSGGDVFAAADDRFQSYPWTFTRQQQKTTANSVPTPATAPSVATPPATPPPTLPAPITELTFGPHWYASTNNPGVTAIPDPPALLPFVGRYAASDGMSTSGAEAWICQGVSSSAAPPSNRSAKTSSALPTRPTPRSASSSASSSTTAPTFFSTVSTLTPASTPPDANAGGPTAR